MNAYMNQINLDKISVGAEIGCGDWRSCKIKDYNLRYFMLHVFTSTLAWVSKMSVDTGHGWAIHAYWLANVYYELNVWEQFKKRFEWALKGKRYSHKEIGDYFKEGKNFKDLLKENTCMF